LPTDIVEIVGLVDRDGREPVPQAGSGVLGGPLDEAAQ
jgi:hypothetical protein